MKHFFGVLVCIFHLVSSVGCGNQNISDGVDAKNTYSATPKTNNTIFEKIVRETETESFFETETESKFQTETKDSEQEVLENHRKTEVGNFDKLSNKKIGWYFMKTKDHSTPRAPSEAPFISKYDGFYVGDVSEKKIYLTFDEGYENGYSEKILDILKEHNIRAAFFVTKSYIEKNEELVKRMVYEGHIVGNHSVKHLSSPDLTDAELEQELVQTEECFKNVVGQDMPKVFRPPMGEFSERTLAVTQSLGYKTIFWSFAYKDWDIENQPGKEAAYNNVIENYHNGEIALLHAVSKSNVEALGDIIETLKEKGFSFGSLEEL